MGDISELWKKWIKPTEKNVRLEKELNLYEKNFGTSLFFACFFRSKVSADVAFVAHMSDQLYDVPVRWNHMIWKVECLWIYSSDCSAICKYPYKYTFYCLIFNAMKINI